MTADRRILLYSGALLVLVVLLIVGALFRSRPADLGFVYPGMSTESVESIAIAGDAGINLSLTPDGWVIESGDTRYPAREDRIGSLLTELAESRLVRRVTGNEELWPQFGLADSEAWEIRLSTGSGAGSRMLSAFWGDQSQEPGLIYVRRTGSDVFAADGQVSFYFEQPATYWSYLRMFPEDRNADEVISIQGVIELELESGETLVARPSWQKSNDAWINADGDALDSGPVERVAREFANLVGRDFYRGSLSAAIPVGSMLADFSDGGQFSAQFLRTDSGAIAVPEGEDLPGAVFGGFAYELPIGSIERLFPAEPLQS